MKIFNFLKKIKEYNISINKIIHSQNIILKISCKNKKPNSKFKIKEKNNFKIIFYDKNNHKIKTISYLGNKWIQIKEETSYFEIYNDNMYSIYLKKFTIFLNMKFEILISNDVKEPDSLNKENFFFIFSLGMTGSITLEKTLQENGIIIARAHNFDHIHTNPFRKNLSNFSEMFVRSRSIEKKLIKDLMVELKNKNLVMIVSLRDEFDRALALMFSDSENLKNYKVNKKSFFTNFYNKKKISKTYKNYLKDINKIFLIKKQKKEYSKFIKKINFKFFENYILYKNENIKIFFTTNIKMKKFLKDFSNIYKLKYNYYNDQRGKNKNYLKLKKNFETYRKKIKYQNNFFDNIFNKLSENSNSY